MHPGITRCHLRGDLLALGGGKPGKQQVAPACRLLVATFCCQRVPDNGFRIVIGQSATELIQNSEMQLGPGIALFRLAADGR